MMADVSAHMDRGAYAEGHASRPDYAHRIIASSPAFPRCSRALICPAICLACPEM